MPAILLFSKEAPTITAEALLEVIGEELGFDAGVTDVEQDASTGAIREATFTVTQDEDGDDEEGGTAALTISGKKDRSEDIAALIDEVVEQAPELKDELTGNRVDITVRFDEGDEEEFAGCILAYALATMTGSGLLAVGMPVGGGCDHDHEDGEECDHEHDEDDETTFWFSDAEEFANVFFVQEEDEEGDDEDEK